MSGKLVERRNSIRSIFVCYAFIFLNVFSVFAQQSLNFDFEKPSAEGVNRPWGWAPVNWGAAYFLMDSTVSHGGQYSLRASCHTDTCGPHALRFDIEPFELRGHSVELSAFFKSKNLEGQVSLSIGYAVLTEDHAYEETEVSGIPKRGMLDWDTSHVELFIPQEAQVLFIKVNYMGSGSVWCDDMVLKRDGKRMHEVQVAEPFSEKQLKWIAKNCSMLEGVTTRATQSKNADLKPFLKSVGDSRIVALGESTHGTAEFFTLKHRLLTYLVVEAGFRVFVMEDNQLAVEEVNKYVLSGKGRADESMRFMFAIWNVQEVVEMIEWVRLFNENHPDDPVYFVGMDMQDVVAPIEAVSAFLQKTDPEMLVQFQSFFSELKAGVNTIYSATDEMKLNWFQQAEKLVAAMQTQKLNWYKTASDSTEILLGLQYGNLIRQYCESHSKGYWALYRDEAMAQNVSWILEERYPGKKMVIWAHDSHISKGQHPNSNYNLNFSISTGSFLAKKYGNDYKAYSLASYGGYNAAVVSYFDYTRIQAPLYPAPVGTLDEAMHQIAEKNDWSSMFVPLNRELEWLSQPQPKRFANHVSIDYGYFERVSLPNQFDGIFFVDSTSGATKISYQ